MINYPTSNNVKYCGILGLALVLSAITYTYPLHWLLINGVKSIYAFQSRWMAYSHSLVSWISLTIYLLVLLSALVAPFILTIVLLLQQFKPELLPDDDKHFIKPLNFWANLVLIMFGCTLVGRALESVGVL